MTDSDGTATAPDRYMAQGRETIDRIRDRLGDEGFIFFCRGNAMKYMDRAGLKDSATKERDLRCALWYRQMARHVRLTSEWGLDNVKDPRHERSGFEPYCRQGYP